MLVSRRSSRICTKTSGLDLPPADPSEAMKTYFEKCDEKIGFVPHVLRAYAHDNTKLEAFAAFYNDLVLAPSGLSKLEREMVVSSCPARTAATTV
jgi:uncharacterized peroxidase-related enzyme